MTDYCAVWYPTIFHDLCDGCEKLEEPRRTKFCPNLVFEIKDGKAVVAHPYKCVYGCVACQPLCPRKAIAFPQRIGTTTTKNKQKKGLLRKTKCEKCGKTFWTNRDIALCFDCEK
jgi:NAD-dependent dihydropyrimidine dehydrogenase PreA subunit